jgi:uncharacterized membrane protein
MEPALPQTKSYNFFLRLHPIHRIIIGFIFSFITYLFLKNTGLDKRILLTILWDVFALTLVAITWIIFCTRSTIQIRQLAQKEDGSLIYVLLIILISCFASMFAVLLLIISKEAAKTPAMIYVPVAIGGMLLSWALLHTTFTTHYARLYYRGGEKDAHNCERGLDFPSEMEPDYLDFAYFAFVIGMTFQVSDVQVTSRTIRRLALLHGLLSFGLNTFVVALTINLIAGLKG